MKTTVPFHEFAAGAWLKFVESLPMAVVIWRLSSSIQAQPFFT